MNNRNFSISYEEIINSLSVPKSQKARLYWMIIKQNGYSKKDGQIIWEDDKIKGFQLFQSVEYMDITINLDKGD